MRVNLEREVAAAVLGGGKGTEPVLQLFTKGLRNFREVRSRLWNGGLREASGSLKEAHAGRLYVRAALRRGASVRIHFVDRSPSGATALLLTIERPNGAPVELFDVPPAASELTRRVGTDVAAAVRVVLAIERARKRCYELCEEATRWL